MYSEKTSESFGERTSWPSRD